MLQLGWRDGVLTAQNQPLGDFLRELQRYRPGVLRWEPSLEALRVTGSFRLDDTDRILILLASTLGLEVQNRTRYWVSLHRALGRSPFGDGINSPIDLLFSGNSYILIA